MPRHFSTITFVLGTIFSNGSNNVFIDKRSHVRIVGTERLRPVGVLHVDGYVGMPGPFLTGVTSLELSLGRGNGENRNDPSQ